VDFWLAIVLICGVPAAIGGFASIVKMILNHDLEVAKIKAAGSESMLQKKIDQLQDRIAVLENQSAKLQEQITTAHVLLADERHTLDRKLSAMLPDVQTPVEDPRRPESARKSVGL